MKECEKCGNSFSSWAYIDGKHRSFTNRKYCLDCSPFGTHNTKKISVELEQNQYYCKVCGETHSDQFYGKRRNMCGKCFNKEVHDIGKENVSMQSINLVDNVLLADIKNFIVH